MFLIFRFWKINKILNFWRFIKINTREKFSNEPSAKINTHEMQFFLEKKLPQKLVPAKISTIKVVSTIFTENGYYCFCRIVLLEFMCRLFLFAISSFYLLYLLGRLLCYSSQKIFSSVSSFCHLSACSVVFLYV